MEIKIKCSCGQVLKVGTESAGKTGKCPACEGTIKIPTLEEIEEARKAIPQPVEVPESEEEAEEEDSEEEDGDKSETRKFRAPTRSKTRSKMLADVRDTKEDRKKTKTRRAEEGGKHKGKKRGKTRGGRKGKTSVLDKYKRKGRGGEEEEGDYTAKKKSPLKLLIVIGVVVIGGLIAAYALHWGPQGKARARTSDYIELMNAVVRDVREKIIERYEHKMPGNIDDYRSWLTGINETVTEIEERMTPAMKRAYEADDLLHKMLDILSKDAVAIIKERNDTQMAHEFSEEKNKEFIKRFDDELLKVNKIAEDIKTLVKSVELSMTR